MSTPYGNDPQQWGQQPGGYPQQSGYPGQEQWGQQPYQQQYPPSGPQPQQSQYPGYDQQQQWQQPQQPAQQQYGGGYGQYPAFEPDEPKKSKVWLWVSLAVVAVAIAAVAVLGFWKPGFFVNQTFDAASVEEGVVQILGKDMQLDNVQCPEGEKVEKDHTFSCTATVNGEQKKIPITVTDAEADPPVYRVNGPE